MIGSKLTAIIWILSIVGFAACISRCAVRAFDIKDNHVEYVIGE